MSATVIDGKAVAAAVRERVAAEVAELPEAPGLATVLVGDDPASAVYVRRIVGIRTPMWEGMFFWRPPERSWRHGCRFPGGRR